MKLLLLTIFFTLTSCAFAQGFQNLDFEATTVATNDSRKIVPVSEAFPGWTIYKGGVAQTEVLFNTFNGPTSSVALASRYFAITPTVPATFGNFSTFFELSQSDPVTIGLAQSGTIGAGVGSVQFQMFLSTDPAVNSLEATFGGFPLSLQPLNTNGLVKTWVADVSAFAGQSGELKFSITPSDSAFGFFRMDNIAFQSIPEPSTWLLLTAGVGMFVFRHLRRRS